MRAFRNYLLASMWLVAGAIAAHAQATNVILQMSISGTLGIQDTGSNLQPKLSQAGFNNATFASIVGVPAVGGDVVLALNFDFLSAATNMYLTVYNKATRQQLAAVTSAENTTWFADGENLLFQLRARLPVRLPDFAGGELDIVGRGKLVGGVPSGVSANIRGFMVDARPAETLGTTGLIMRAALKTGTALRVLPASSQ